jgi:methionine-rich copper-binding protein CopC
MNPVFPLLNGRMAKIPNRSSHWSRWTGLLLLFLAVPLHAQVPDLTAGGVPNNTACINLGPTGMEGWIYNDGGGRLQETAAARQILVTKVAAGSPADGVLAVGDVILGADGTGSAPVNFTSDARKALALAIDDAEGRNPALLKLLRWRSGVINTVSITLEYLGGSYSATAPYNCAKSAAILEKGIDHIMNHVTGAGYGGFGTTVLLAANDPSNPDNAARQARAQAEAYQLNLTQQQIDDMTSGDLTRAIGKPWSIGPQLITQAEYYLQTLDEAVLPSIRARAIQIANAQSLFGTMGHHYSLPGPNGEVNGPYGIGYGPVNNAGMPCFLGLILASKCGLNDPEILAGIERASKYFAYYADLGTVPYGENKETGSITNNGKSALAAITLGMVDGKEEEAKYFAKLSTFGADERDSGHTGPYFNHLWTPLGSNLGGQDSLAHYFGRTSWLYDLCRRWDGSFVYQPYYQGGGIKGYGQGHEASWTALLTYAAPLAKIHITGKNANPSLVLDAADMTAIEHAVGYNPATRTTSELLDDLKSPLPQLHWSAGNEIGNNRGADHASILPTLIDMAQNGATYAEQHGAIYALGRIADDSTASVLSALCASPNSKVRYMAANALKNLSMTAKTAQAANIVNALVATDRPLLPLDPENPMHVDKMAFGQLLFDSGAGIWGGDRVAGADRSLLYPAFRIIATAPMGGTRESALSIHADLTKADVENLADVLVDVAITQPPGEIMYQHRANAIGAMQTYNFAEGVPASIYAFKDSTKTDPRDTILSILAAYGASNLDVVPDPSIVEFCELLISNSDDHDAGAQAVLDAIANDPLPAVLTPFKSIEWVFADDASLQLPDDRTMLRLHSTDLAKGDSSYTWRKVHGAGNVTFSPNGNGAAKDTLVVFDGTPGVYTFEVTMSDTRGLTETSKTVSVTLYTNGGTLPDNSAPTANAQSITVAQATPAQVILTGTDPEGLALNYTVTGAPAHGHLGGAAPYLVYTADAGYTGPDSIAFQVMDSEGQTGTAVVSITVNPAGLVGAAVYEPFDYPAGLFNGSAGASEVGLDGSWNANSGMNLIGGSLDYGGLLTKGGSIGNLVSGNSFGGSRAINPAALSGNNLLADGSTLWISAVMGHSGSSYNQRLFLALANNRFSSASNNYSINNDGALLGTGVGISISGSEALATHFQDASFGGGASSHVYGNWSAGNGSMASYDHRLVVAKITWGASADTIEIYLPDESLLLPSSPSSVLTLDVDQSTFDTLTFSRSGAPLLDEIRIGASYHSVLQGTVAMVEDTTAPTPDPMGFAIPPMASSPGSITMTAATAHDLMGVEYYFTCAAGGGNDSGWQDSPVYTDSGLTPGVQYSYAVMARDKQPGLNETAASAAASAAIPASGTLPNVVGALQASAESLVTAAGFTVGTISEATAYSLSVPAGHVLSQTPPAGSVAAYGAGVHLEISIGQDPALPTLASADIADDQGGGPVVINTLITYTLNFNEDMDASTVSAADFVNAGNAAITIGAIAETSPGVFTIEVTPTSTGLLRLSVAAGAGLLDAQGDAFNTSRAIIDDTVLLVNLPDEIVPNVVGMEQSAAESAIIAANLVVGTIRQIFDEVVPLGNVYSQSPTGGGSLPGQYPVDLVISAGPPPDTTSPVITLINPADGVYNVEVDADLVVSFDEDVFVNTGNIVIRNLNDGTDTIIPVSDTAQVSTYANVLTINPAVNLVAGKSYAVRIAAGAVRDESGNGHAGILDDRSWNFSTAVSSLSSVLFTENFEAPNVAAYSQGTSPTGWVRANQGFNSSWHGLTDKAGGDFSAPDPNHQAYAFRYTNTGLTTAEGVIGTITADTTYEVSFDVIRDDGSGGDTKYSALMLAFPAGAARNDCRSIGTAIQLASKTGNATTDGNFTKVTFQSTVNAGSSAIGRDFAFRFIGSGESALVDNVVVRTVSPFAGDQVPPAVVSLTPADDSTEASLVNNLVIVFDENIAIDAGYIRLKNLTTTSETVINVIDGTQVLISGDTLQINPTEDLDTNTFYAVRIDPGVVTDLAGNDFPGISDDISWTFNTGEVDDSIAPAVVSVTPADGMTGVSYRTALGMNFDENVVANSGKITLRNLTDSTEVEIDISDSSQVSVSGAVVTVTPSSYLGEGKDYAVRIDAAAILDLAGNPYAGINDDLTWNFSTSAINPPAILAFDPADEAVGVDPGASLSVTFDENIMIGTGNITLRNLSNPGDTVIDVTDSGQVSVTGSVLTIQPASGLPEGKVFAVLIDGSAVLDPAGNAFGGIASEATWNFATGVSTEGSVFVDDFEVASGSPDVNAADSLGYTSKKTGSSWVRATNGFGASYQGIVDESSGQFVDPNGEQAYAFRYTNSGITLAEGRIGSLTAGNTYRVSFYVVGDGYNNGGGYAASLVTFAPGASRTDMISLGAGTSKVLAQSSGSYSGGSYHLVTLEYTSNGTADASVLGHDVALRFKGATTSANIDNVMVRVESPAGPLDHFTISPIDSPQTVGTPITGITLTAKDASDNTVTSFTGTVTFGGTGGFSGTSANFVDGVLSGVSVMPTMAGSDLTLTVNDGAGHAGSATIAIINPMTTAYESWAEDSDFAADSNNDGIANGMAWVLGAEHPDANATGLIPTTDATSDPDGKLLFIFRRNSEAMVDGKTGIVVEYGGELGGWTAATHQGTGPEDITISEVANGYGTGIDRVTVALPASLAANGRLFARLKVVLAAP